MLPSTPIKTLATLVLLSVGQVKAYDVTIGLFATELFDCDATSACDAFVRIHCQSSGSTWTKCGETAIITDDAYPIWREKFTFSFEAAQALKWKFEIIDKDVMFDDPVGTVETSAADFLKATETLSSMKLTIPNNRGSLYVEHR